MNDVVSLIGIPDDNRARVLVNPGRIADIEVSIPGTTEINNLIDKNVVPFRTVALGGSRPKDVDLGQPSVVLNTIGEADGNKMALMQATELIEKLDMDVPVLNHPDNILRTTRNNVCKLIEGIAGIRVPKTIRVAPRYLSDVERLVQNGTVAVPFIFRQAGLHNGLQTFLLENLEQLHELEQFAFDGRDYYITEFVDFRSADGLYRKSRFFVIDGAVYPRHHIISASWNIHSRSGIKGNSDCEKEAEEFVRHPGNQTLQHCRSIYKILNLDFFGIDCNVSEEDELLIFEVNASMTSTSRSNTRVDYLDQAESSIRSAVTRMLKERLDHV